MRLGLGLLLIAGLTGAGGGFALLSWYRQPLTAESVIFEVRPGESGRQVWARLNQFSSPAPAWVWSLATRLFRIPPPRVGEYEIPAQATRKDVLLLVASGRSLQKTLTIVEGMNLYEIAGVIEKSGLASVREFLKISQDKGFLRDELRLPTDSLEGYLFPETYAFTKFTGLKSLIGVMVKKTLTELQSARRMESAYSRWTDHQVLTLASIVEKETGAAEERPLIASVFHNRLRIGMRLQTDPTVIYAHWLQTGSYLDNIRRVHLLEPHPYNTYSRTGLPPGPIASPGRESIRAVFHPASSRYLYFVSKNQGTHQFSETLREHEAAVRAYQLNSAARSGKSWRQKSAN